MMHINFIILSAILTFQTTPKTFLCKKIMLEICKNNNHYTYVYYFQVFRDYPRNFRKYGPGYLKNVPMEDWVIRYNSI